MTPDRYRQLMDNPEETLTKEEWDSGWHFCNEFDGLVVGPGEAEALVCSCDHPAIEAWKNSEEAQKMQEEQDARMEKMLKEMSQTDPLEFFEKKLDNDSESD